MEFMRFRRIERLGFLCLLATALMSGCGSPDTGGKLALSGSITFQGQPLKEGSIEFTSDDGNQQTGAAIEDGKFSIDAIHGLLPGAYTVRIHSADESEVHANEEAPGMESIQQTATERIPAEYNVNSKEVVQVKEDSENDFVFDIP